MLQKQFTVKVYDSDGTTLLKTLAPGTLRDPPTFRARINGGLGEMVLNLALAFDDFDEGTSINYMNIVDVWAVDQDNPRGRRIYRGFISRYQPYAEGSDQGVQITCLGLASLLTYAHYTNTTHTAVDPEDIAQNIIDDFNSVYTAGLIDYSGTTSPVGTNVTYTFTDLKWFDAIKKTIEFADEGWWWHIDADGQFYLAEKPSSATHTLTVGKDVESFRATKDSEGVVNYVRVVRSGGTTTTYQDATSISEFGRRSSIIQDSSITNATTADQRGNKELNDKKDAKVKALVTVNAEFDLESLKIGDTVNIRNFKTGGNPFVDNTQIVGLTYEADRVRLELDVADLDLGLALQDFIS